MKTMTKTKHDMCVRLPLKIDVFFSYPRELFHHIHTDILSFFVILIGSDADQQSISTEVQNALNNEQDSNQMNSSGDVDLTSASNYVPENIRKRKRKRMQFPDSGLYSFAQNYLILFWKKIVMK